MRDVGSGEGGVAGEVSLLGSGGYSQEKRPRKVLGVWGT